jgi:preprotein translocase subunit SecG
MKQKGYTHMKLFDKPKPQYSSSEIRQKEEAVKRTMTFIILVLMILSLTMCNTPSYEEYSEGLDETEQTTETR